MRPIRVARADLDATLENMATIQVRRLPVMNRNKRLVGILSLSDAARVYSADAVGVAFAGSSAQTRVSGSSR